MNPMQRNTSAHGRRETRPRECTPWLPVLAQLPAQQLCDVFEPEYAFGKGTLFPELEKPLMVGRCAR